MTNEQHGTHIVPLDNEALLDAITAMHKTLLDAITAMHKTLSELAAMSRVRDDEVKSIVVASEQMMSAAVIHDKNLLKQYRSCMEGNTHH